MVPGCARLPRAHSSVAALHDKTSKLYDNMTEISADLKVGDVKADGEENLAFFGRTAHIVVSS